MRHLHSLRVHTLVSEAPNDTLVQSPAPPASAGVRSMRPKHTDAKQPHTAPLGAMQNSTAWLNSEPPSGADLHGKVVTLVMAPMAQSTQYRTIKIDGVSIFYREAGPRDAATLLLLHGLPSSSRVYEPLLTRLSDVGKDPNVERYDPDLWMDEFAFLSRRPTFKPNCSTTTGTTSNPIRAGKRGCAGSSPDCSFCGDNTIRRSRREKPRRIDARFPAPNPRGVAFAGVIEKVGDA
jgi:hypothetical protein